jgi:hypothetical protein
MSGKTIPDRLQNELDAERIKLADLQRRIKNLVLKREKQTAEDSKLSLLQPARGNRG